MMEEEAKRQLKAAELQAKKSKLRIWTSYVPPVTNSKAIHDQNFTGKVLTNKLYDYVHLSKHYALSYHMYSRVADFFFLPGCGGCKRGLCHCG